MSSHRRNFECFNAVGAEGSHKSSLPFKHHTSRLPRIHHHGMVAHRDPLEECCLCCQYRHTLALEAIKTQVAPLCHTGNPYHQQYVLRGANGLEEPPVAHSGHLHRSNKRVVLVKNSDPSSRKTVVLQRRSLQSFGLFLEEASELMQYHIRKLCTLEGSKVRSPTPGTRRLQKHIFSYF